MKLNEDFKSDFEKLLTSPWSEDAEKKIVKILDTNKQNIENDPTKGQNYLKQFFTQNKTLLQNSCSDKFVELFNVVIGTPSNTGDNLGGNDLGLGEGKILKDAQLLIDSIKFKKEKPSKIKIEEKLYYLKINESDKIQKSVIKDYSMKYKYYRIQFLKESKYVAIPLFAVNANTEHRDVLHYALESKQIKTQKGVDFVIEVSPKEFEESIPDIEGNYGAEPKEEKPQDASIKSSKNQFDSVKQEKGAEQKKPEKLQEALMSLFEDENDLFASDPMSDSYDEGYDAGVEGYSIDSNPYEQSSKDFKNWREGWKAGLSHKDMDDEEELDEHSAAFDKASGKSHIAEDAPSPNPFADSSMGDTQDSDFGDGADAERPKNNNDIFDFGFTLEEEEELDEASEAEDAAEGKYHFAEEEELNEYSAAEDEVRGRYHFAEDDEPDYRDDNMFLDNEPNDDETGGFMDFPNGLDVEDEDLWEPANDEEEEQTINQYADLKKKKEEAEDQYDPFEWEPKMEESAYRKIKKNAKKIKESETIEDEGSLNESAMSCPKCDSTNCYPIAGEYNECAQCHNHWKTINENDTSDMSVYTQPAFGGDRKNVINLNPFGKDNKDYEYIEDEKVLEEKFVKFVLKNCQNSKQYISEGKFNLKRFLASKSFGFINILKEEFTKSLTEDENSNDMDINFVDFDNSTDQIKISYSTNTENDGEYIGPLNEFLQFLENKDPNWEDYYEDQTYEDQTEGEDTSANFTAHNTERYWDMKSMEEQNRLTKDFLKTKGIS